MKVGLKWKDLKVGITYRASSEAGQPIQFTVLSFRKVMAIVKMFNGQYELLEPGYVDDHFYDMGVYEDKPVSKVNMIDEYVKVDASTDNIAKSMIDGEIFYSEKGSASFMWSKQSFINNFGGQIFFEGDFYRKVSRPITWQEAVRDFMGKQSVTGKYFSTIEMLDDEFVLTEGEFIEMCAIVTSLTKGE